MSTFTFYTEPTTGALIATDDVTDGNNNLLRYQVMKLDGGAPGATAPITGTVANGLLVDVSRIQGTVGVTQSTSPWIISGGVVLGAPIPPGSNTIGVINQGTSPWVVSGGVSIGSPLPAGTNTLGSVNQGSPTTSDSAWPVTLVASSGYVSVSNSTSTPLASSAVFTGVAEDVSSFAEICLSTYSNVGSANNGLSVQFSSDSINWDFKEVYSPLASGGYVYCVVPKARYYRVVYTNGNTAQTVFRLQSLLRKFPTVIGGDAGSPSIIGAVEPSTVTGTPYPLIIESTVSPNLRVVLAKGSTMASVASPSDSASNVFGLATFTQNLAWNTQNAQWEQMRAVSSNDIEGSGTGIAAAGGLAYDGSNWRRVKCRTDGTQIVSGTVNIGNTPTITQGTGNAASSPWSVSGNVQGVVGGGVSVVGTNPLILGVVDSGNISRFLFNAGLLDNTTGANGLGVEPVLFDIVGGSYHRQTCDVSGRTIVVGAVASGSTYVGSPVLSAGADTGGIVRTLLTSNVGRLSVDVNSSPTLGVSIPTPLGVSGTITSNQGTSPWIVSGGVSIGSPLPPGSNTIGSVTQGTTPWTTLTSPVINTGTISGTGQVVDTVVSGLSSVDVQISGVWTGGILFETSLDGITFFNSNVFRQGTATNSAPGVQVQTNDIYTFHVPSSGVVRVAANSWTTGSATIKVVVGTGSLLSAITGGPISVQQGSAGLASWLVSVSNAPTVAQGTGAANSSPWPVKSIFAGKASYSCATSGGVSQVVAVNTIQSMGYIWHPVSVSLRYQLNKIIISVPTGGSLTGVFALQFRRISAVGTGGVSGVIQAYDGVDSVSNALVVFGATSPPTRLGAINNETIFNMASLSSPYILDMSEMLEGKPIVMRANTGEGWEISALVYTAISVAQRVGVTFIWTEE